MNKLVRLTSGAIIFIATISLLTGCNREDRTTTTTTTTTTTANSTDDLKKISESMGFFLIENIQSQGVEVDIDSLVRGIQNAKAGKKAPLTKEEFSQRYLQFAQQTKGKRAVENLKKAEEFLAKNKSTAGIISLENGKLQYVILSEGSGDEVDENSTPLINYEGKFADGKVFDSSKAHGKPVPISLKATIPGFKEGLSGMKKGEKRRLFIHPDLGYKTAGQLPPNSLLIFDVEIVEADTKKAVDRGAAEDSDDALDDEQPVEVPEDQQDSSDSYNQQYE